MMRTRISKILAVCIFLAAETAWTNHPVMVEGNCMVPPFGVSSSAVVPTGGVCGDYDGDGRIGLAEDEDGDRVFGTIGAALAAAGANQNGSVLIVSSGTFAETVTITAANGNVTLEAAPGVLANIDAVFQGDNGNATRQAAPGIIVDAPATRQVLIRNIASRNWTDGIRVQGTSRVTLSGVRIEGNRDFGIRVLGSARVAIDKSEVTASGFRFGGVTTAAPGTGISFEDTSTGSISRTLITGSAATGINKSSSGTLNVSSDVVLFDNKVDRAP